MNTEPITSLAHVASAYGTTMLKPARNSSDFGGMVGDAASAALNTLRTSERVTAQGVAGKADVQDVVQAMSNAEVTVQAVVNIRDKIVGAYMDVLRMTV